MRFRSNSITVKVSTHFYFQAEPSLPVPSKQNRSSAHQRLQYNTIAESNNFIVLDAYTKYNELQIVEFKRDEFPREGVTADLKLISIKE